MKKLKLIIMGFVSISMLSMVAPITAWANENEENIEESVTTVQFEEALLTVTDTATKYCNAENVNIRTEPNVESEVLDQAYVNTSFETVAEIDGWTMITTQDGYAYIKSEFLSDTETEVIIKEPENSYSDDELYIMAHVLAGEAQSYPDEEQRYVGSVVLNRVKHPEFPDTIKEVVFQKGQYACTWDGNYYREPTDRNWANAEWLLENGSVFPGHVIWQSGSRQGNGVYLKTDVHYYCY